MIVSLLMQGCFGLIAIGLGGLGLWSLGVPRLLRSLPDLQQSQTFQTLYQQVLLPHLLEARWVLINAAGNLFLLIVPLNSGLKRLELGVAIVVTLQILVLGIKLINQWFDCYWLPSNLQEDKRINSELLLLGRFLVQVSLGLGVIFVFAETHALNLVGLFASVGIGGVALAFASQKIVEQILWSGVIYIDRPFDVGDYIHLPDRTLGRVEELGWRSTKIRLSGKNTLAIIPNSALAQVNIENLSRAQRIILMINLSFFRTMADEEKALIRQLILNSTTDIIGIDHALTEISFEDCIESDSPMQLQAKAIFFVLGAAETSIEIRRSLLGIARDNIVQGLQAYGITFEFQERVLDVTQPMNI